MRYDWAASETGRTERVGAVLRFDRVLKVSHLGLDEGDEGRVLNLLAATFEKTDPPSGMVLLAFADGAVVRLEVECLEAELQRHRPAPPGAGMPRPRADQRRGDLTKQVAERTMAVTLDMGAADFEPRFRALLAAKREAAVDVDAAVAAIIADVRGARRRGADRLHAALRPRRSVALGAARRAGRDRGGGRRLRPGGARRRWNSPISASSPITTARAQAISPMSTSSASSSAGAGGRSIRSASMCRAARRAIPRP